MVVYLDVLFAVNTLMDGATLLAAARLGGVQVRKMRLIFSAALGGGYAAVSYTHLSTRSWLTRARTRSFWSPRSPRPRITASS